MSRHRNRTPAWWELVLPAGIWLLAAHVCLLGGRALLRLDIRWRWSLIMILRLSSRLSRAGHHSWRYRGGKWR